MAARRLQHEWRQLQNSHNSHIVFHRQYELQYKQCLMDYPEFLNDVDDNGIGLSISLSDEIASLFPTQDIILFPTNITLTTWTAYLAGPQDTVYDSFRYELRVEIPHTYPHDSPKIAFLTPIFHPNIDFFTGEICLDTLKENWTPSWTLEATLRAILLLLSQPEHSSPLNIDASKLLRSGDARGYWSMARLYTIKHAIPLPTIQQQQLEKQLEEAKKNKQTNNDNNSNIIKSSTDATNTSDLDAKLESENGVECGDNMVEVGNTTNDCSPTLLTQFEQDFNSNTTSDSIQLPPTPLPLNPDDYQVQPTATSKYTQLAPINDQDGDETTTTTTPPPVEHDTGNVINDDNQLTYLINGGD